MHLRFGCLAALAALALAGCRGFEIEQLNVFSDEDGHLVKVAYGRSQKEHVNYFIAPATEKKMEFRSKLVVRVKLPDEHVITAWQCMNFQRNGTMYRTDDEVWMVLVDGFSCTLYCRTKADKTQYLEVYRGVLCDSPDIKK